MTRTAHSTCTRLRACCKPTCGPASHPIPSHSLAPGLQGRQQHMHPRIDSSGGYPKTAALGLPVAAHKSASGLTACAACSSSEPNAPTALLTRAPSANTHTPNQADYTQDHDCKPSLPGDAWAGGSQNACPPASHTTKPQPRLLCCLLGVCKGLLACLRPCVHACTCKHPSARRPTQAEVQYDTNRNCVNWPRVTHPEQCARRRPVCWAQQPCDMGSWVHGATLGHHQETMGLAHTTASEAAARGVQPREHRDQCLAPPPLICQRKHGTC